MRLIGHLPNEHQAGRFGDFLYSRNIENQIEPVQDGRWEVWIYDEDQIEAAASLLKKFLERPKDPLFLAGAVTGAHQKKQEQLKIRRARSRVVDGRTMFYRPAVSMGIVTVSLMVISVGVTWLTRLGKVDRYVRPLQITESRVEGQYLIWQRDLPEIRHGQVWRLFTPMFLHFGILHILFNMLWLMDLGRVIESHKGSLYFLALVLAIAGVSNVAQCWVSGPQFGGMSGVVFGLLGYIWMQGKFNPASPMRLNPQIVQFMIIWFFICLAGLVGPVANMAHGVGAVVGIAWGYLSARLRIG